MNYYALGGFENPKHVSKEHLAILQGIAKLKSEGKLVQISFEYKGGTDATDTRERPDSGKYAKWHDKREAAFVRLLEYAESGKIEPSSLLEHIKANKDKIKGYIDAEDRAKYLTENKLNDLFEKSKGTEHGGLYDAGLALMRAENMKKMLEGDDAVLDPKKDSITLNLNTEKDRSKEHRNAGVRLKIAKVERREIESEAARQERSELETEVKIEPQANEAEADRNGRRGIETVVAPTPAEEPAEEPEVTPTPEAAPAEEAKVETRTDSNGVKRVGIFHETGHNLKEGTITDKAGNIFEGEFDENGKPNIGVIFTPADTSQEAQEVTGYDENGEPVWEVIEA